MASRKEQLIEVLTQVHNRVLAIPHALDKIHSILQNTKDAIISLPIRVYKKGMPEGKVFNHPDDVPKGQGWNDPSGTYNFDDEKKDDGGNDTPRTPKRGRPAKE